MTGVIGWSTRRDGSGREPLQDGRSSSEGWDWSGGPPIGSRVVGTRSRMAKVVERPP